MALIQSRLCMVLGFLVATLAGVASPAEAGSTGKLKLLGGPAGATVQLDDVTVGTLPLRHSLPVDPGTRTLALVINGEVAYQESVDVLPRKRVRHRIPKDLAAHTATPETAGVPKAPSLVAPLSPPGSTTPGTATPSSEAAPAEPAPILAMRRILTTPELARSIAEDPAPVGLTVGATVPVASATAANLAVDPAALDLSPAHVAEMADPDTVTTDNAEQPEALGPRPAKRAKAAPKKNDQAQEDEGGILDMFIFETFAGPSFMAMALGRDQEVIAELAALPVDGSSELDLTQLEVPNVIRTVSGAGSTFGGAASVRLAFISLGGRMSYSSYDQLDMMTLTGELAFRAYAEPVEFYLGFGLGAGFLYDDALNVEQTDGLALRMGLGLNFRVTDHMSVGVGADAVGWFLAGKGISPAQLGDIDEETDHPIGGQVPVQLNFSVLL